MINGLEGAEEKQQEAQVDIGGSRFSRLRWTVHVEPVIFLFAFGTRVLMPTLTALAYRKVCLTAFNGSLDICDSLDSQNYSNEENIVQTETALWMFRINLCYEVPSILTCFFYGTVSDNVSRKLALVLPAFGQMLSCTSHLLQSVYMDLPVAGMLIGSVISGSCGGWISFNMACFSYIVDVTSVQERTFRYAIGTALVNLGFCVALLTAGLMLDKTSYTLCLAFTLGIFFTIILYVLVWIKEPPSRMLREQSRATSCRSLCTLKSLKEGVGCVFKKRPDGARCHVLMLFLLLFSCIIAGIRK